MNLFDVVSRADSFAKFDPALVSAHVCAGPDGSERCIDIRPGGSLSVNRANLVTALRVLPHTPGWVMRPVSKINSSVEIALLGEGGGAVLCRRSGSTVTGPVELQLMWPIGVSVLSGFSLSIRNIGAEIVRIAVGPSYSARPLLLKTLVGRGVEVGPGMNPQVFPRDGLEVSYVEVMSGRDWERAYAKKGLHDGRMEGAWSRYVIGSAHDLKEFESESLDFIFSNHVFEHFPNPLGVLQNWSSKLRCGGVVAGIVPDARYTFDLRQPLSTLIESEVEYAEGSFELQRRHYERWCEHTAPYNSVNELISRNYSVHAKYYSVDTFRDLLERSAQLVGWSDVSLNFSRNGKDFGFFLRK